MHGCMSVQGPNLVIHHDDEVLENMNEWSKEQHGLSGLTERSRGSTTTMEEAEYKVGPTWPFLPSWPLKHAEHHYAP